MKKKPVLAAAVCLLLLLSGCTGGSTTSQVTPTPAPVAPEVPETPYVDRVVVAEEVKLEPETVALAETPAPAVSLVLEPEAPGTAVKTTDKAVIDYSNAADGYVMAQFTAQTEKKLKAVVKGPSGVNYQYTITPQGWWVFPLSDGNGEYQVTLYENVQDKSYANVCSVTLTAALTDEFAPFLRPNLYVDYASAPETVAKGSELIGSLTDPLEKVKAVYDFVVTNLTYDKDRAANVKSGYLPKLDAVLAERKGICFDYAALMTGMLRSQGVPCKLVVGYAGTAYHAWINVWSAETGWVEGVVYFDGASWQRMDPTFASSANQSEAIMQYIGDGANYTAKYLY